MENRQPIMPGSDTQAGQGSTPANERVQERVRQFYDQVGWQTEGDGNYQNARYEDLRPVSRDYIHRCHLRVNRHLDPHGRYLLDAGSGPVQYAEYLTYSQGYQYRVCADLSMVAVQEARRRLGTHALCVVADVSLLPFASGVFEGAVSLHTFHHLQLADQPRAYAEIVRVLAAGARAVVVNGWTDSPLMRRWSWLVNLAERAGQVLLKLRGKKPLKSNTQANNLRSASDKPQVAPVKPAGTYVQKLDAAWLRDHLSGKIQYELFPWRSVSVRFLRAVVHRATAGALFLKFLYALEERYPRYFAEQGQYPMVVLKK